MVCPVGTDQLSTPNLAWIQLHCDSMLMSHITWSQTFNLLVNFSQSDPNILILHTTNYFCCSSSWLMLNNWKLAYISFSAILLVMAAHLGSVGEALMTSLLSYDFLEWLDVHIFEQGKLKAVLIQF